MHLPLIWGEDVLSPVIMAVFMAELPQHSSQSAVCLVCTNIGWATESALALMIATYRQN